MLWTYTTLRPCTLSWLGMLSCLGTLSWLGMLLWLGMLWRCYTLAAGERTSWAIPLFGKVGAAEFPIGLGE